MAHDEFYVGYLPMPPGMRRWVRRTVGGLAIGVAAAGALLAFAQRDPGDGRWHDDRRVFEGTLVLGPYPRLITDDGHAHFLVGEGKVGPGEIDAALDAERVTVRGTLIERAGLRLIELAGNVEVDERAESPFEAIGQADTPGAPVSVVGEIVDAKCFAGAMKPGDGKAHKACAILCIRGGIPPVFVAADVEHAAHGAVVRMRATPAEDGPGAWTLAPEWIGQGVKIEGRLYTIDGQRWLEVTRAMPSLAAIWGAGCAEEPGASRVRIAQAK